MRIGSKLCHLAPRVSGANVFAITRQLLIVTLKYGKLAQPVAASTVLFKDGFQEYEIGVDPLLHPNERELKRIISHIKPILGQDRIEDIYLFEHMQLVHKEKVMIACEDANEQTKLFTPEDLAAMIIKGLCTAVVDYIFQTPAVLSLSNQNVSRDIIAKGLTRAVFGVPATATEKFKESLRKAALLAGMEETYFMVESTAAALSYGLILSGEKRVLTFDMGGGTADVTILDISTRSIEVLWTCGNDHLGGRMIDNLLFHWVLTKKLLPQGNSIPLSARLA